MRDEWLSAGMGELHLDIYVERMKREYGVECKVRRPRHATVHLAPLVHS